MRKVFSLFAFLSCIILNAQENKSPEFIALKNVNIIDVEGSQVRPGMTVVLSGNRIISLDRSNKIAIPQKALTIDATGKYLIPGLWDMHMHVYGNVLEDNSVSRLPTGYRFTMCIAAGVTGIREMWTTMDDMKQINLWRKQFYEKPGTIPRFGAVGTMVDGVPPVWTGSDTASTVEQARLLVQRIKKSGVDFVKTYNNLSPDVYFAIADEAKKQNIPFAGHVPSYVLFTEASRWGQLSIEHLTGMGPYPDLDCESAEKKINSAFKREMAKESADTVRLKQARNVFLDLCDPAKASAIYKEVAMNGTWQVPALIEMKRHADTTIFSDPRLKYIPIAERRRWETRTGVAMKSRPPQLIDGAQRHLKNAMAVIVPMKKAGIQFLAGTDVNNHYLYAGFSVHDELALFVEAGLTPIEALQTATINPAKFLGTTDSLGKIEKGKIADMVLLDANPLTDIRNTRLINAVFVNGKYLSKETLDKMLFELEIAASAKK